jgi:ribosome-associated translation inhibitor RaiA
VRIEVVAAGIEVSEDLRREVERRLLTALSRFGFRVERVEVRLSDDANPLGGVDRCCRMRAWLRHHGSVEVRTLDGDAAIERAVVRLARRVEWALADRRAAAE